MLGTVAAYAVSGVDAFPVRVEALISKGLPGFSMFGIPDAAARETRERVRAALINSGYEWPLQRIEVNVRPARVRPAGPGIDLALAAAILYATGQLASPLRDLPLVGELALDGSTRPVRGALPMAEAAAAEGAAAVVVPSANAAEASYAEGIATVGIDSLAGLRRVLEAGDPPPTKPPTVRQASAPHAPDLADIRGLLAPREAMEIAAAGGHSLLLIAPPGSGRSMLAGRMTSILPPMDREEHREVLRISSVAGRRLEALPVERPLRAPHHTISPGALGGGGPRRLPGEMTLAHRGVLFLDELHEFSRDAWEIVLSAQKQREVVATWRDERLHLPADFFLMAAAPLCPCGGKGTGRARCKCSRQDVKRYLGRLAGPAAAFELIVRFTAPRRSEIADDPGESSAAVRARVIEARARQARRLGPGRCNAEMTDAEVAQCGVPEDIDLGADVDRGPIRLARTLADLAGSERVQPAHLSRAAQLHRP